MKWLRTDMMRSTLLWVALLMTPVCATASRLQAPADTLTPEAAASLQVSVAADSAVVVRVDSSTTVRLPLSALLHALGQTAPSVASDTASTVRDTLTSYDRHKQRALRRWDKLIPNQAVLQYAGSIGLLSAGIGWHYGRGDHWESEFLVGFLPKYQSDEVSSTFTVKQRYVPWHCRVHRRWTIEPLTAGLFFNFIGGEDFWRRQPSRYPKKYYGFSTKVRTNIFIGQRVKFTIPRSRRLLHQSVSFYYEISSCDLYIVSKATNKDFPWSETLSLALGLRWEM